jgi:hypothetical protein
MQRTLSEHITWLEEKIAALKKQLDTSEKSPLQKAEIKVDLGIAERALTNFQKAFALEQKLSDSVRSFQSNGR